MTAMSSSFQSYTREERLRVGITGNNPVAAFLPGSGSTGLNFDTTELSQEARDMLANLKEAPPAEKAGEQVEFRLSEEDRLKITLLENMLRSMTGKKIKIRVLSRLNLDDAQTGIRIKLPQVSPPIQPGAGVSMQYHLHESYYEREQMSFASQGIIKTADGRDINFSVELNMFREFATETNISIRAGNAVDPLVINFAGTTPRLTHTKFSFDLDNDGNDDHISFVGPGSGFLALDLNSDGVINNGGELFGPQSGNGFSDLSQYDEDGNQWIDENDEVFNRLRIWTKDADGKDVLFALGQKGVGALYLGNLNTQFSFKDHSNEEQARITHSGIFVKEDGSAGTVQQVDLVV